MNENSCAFSQLSSSFDGVLCPALQQFKQEHEPLNARKQQLFQFANEIGRMEDPAAAHAALLQLKEQVIQFLAILEPHSEREESALFPLLAAYIGRDMGPIAVMEYEHDQAKGKIASFLAGVKELPAIVTAEHITGLTMLIVDAYLILTDHFYKEENVLFPMAEQLLSDSEKEALSHT